MSFKKVCKVCGRQFHSAKYTSRYCSENCYVKAKNWAKEQNCSFINLDVLVNNSGAIKVYEKLGFIPKAQEMYCKL